MVVCEVEVNDVDVFLHNFTLPNPEHFRHLGMVVSSVAYIFYIKPLDMIFTRSYNSVHNEMIWMLFFIEEALLIHIRDITESDHLCPYQLVSRRTCAATNSFPSPPHHCSSLYMKYSFRKRHTDFFCVPTTA